MPGQHISIIVPVCNEQDNIRLFVHDVSEVMNGIGYPYDMMFVDDGSTDDTLAVIKAVAEEYPTILYVSFSRNFGHQNALKAGLDHSEGDCVISMDGDLQHPPHLLPQMIRAWEEGYDIVYTVRKDDPNAAFSKRKTSDMFYRMVNILSDIKLEKGTADFRLMDRKVADIVKDFKEDDIFWRGMVKWLGFKQLKIEYDPAERKAGSSKYTYKKMMQLALRGLTSFSTKPLTIAIYIGFTFSFLSLLYIPYVLYGLYFGHVISGWASTIVTIAFFGGLQLMILGIIGVYIGKLFIQSKQRPHYLIRESKLK